MDGVININKAPGMTSHDVVYRLRKILSVKKIGHTGTLDPDATGVLPMCIGKATKAADMLTAQNKQYVAEGTLGSATDTLDSSGTVTETADVDVTENEILAVMKEFTGEITQIPPMFSAIKVDGKKLCELAREGKTIEREPRTVTVNRIEVLDIDLKNNRFTICVDCSKGTYIRTLCDDIGRRLGCFAHMSALRRTRSGRFKIEDSYKTEQVEEMLLRGDTSFLIPVDTIFEEYPKLILSAGKAKRMCCGIRISAQGAVDGTNYRVYDESGRFLTISAAEDGVLKSLKTFY